MSQYESVNIERHGYVAVVSLNRPEVLNAFNSALMRDLLAAVEEVNKDDSIRVGVLTGEGRAFSAGADLGEAIPEGESVIDQLNLGYKPILMAITNSPQPWLSAVNGAAAGIGSAFAMNCDLTVMAENAYIYQAFTAIGLIPDGGACWHLARTVAASAPMNSSCPGTKCTASSAWNWVYVIGWSRLTPC